MSKQLFCVGLSFVAAMTLASSSAAAPLYSLQHTVNPSIHVGGSPFGPQGSPIDYDFPYQSVDNFAPNNNRVFDETHASVQPGAVGITASAFSITGSYTQTQLVVGQFQFEVVFSSPTSDNIDVVMNLELAGKVNHGFGLSSGVTVFAGAPTLSGGLSSGQFIQFQDPGQPVITTRTGMLASFTDDGTAQSIQTATISNVPVNTPVPMMIQLETSQAYLLQNPTISFGNTFNLSTTGDVFTVLGPDAGDITVDSPDANIVDNQFTLVPEPGTMMCAVGCALMGLVRRRRTRAVGTV